MTHSQHYALTAARLITPLETITNGVVLVRDGRIEALGGRNATPIPAGTPVFDYGENVLAPGLIDLHVHGGAGRDLMAIDAAGLTEFEAHLARHGVTSYYPTTVTAPLDGILASLEKLGRAVRRAGQEERDGGAPRAQPLGIHLEGPFLSHARRGVHPPEALMAPTPQLLERFRQAAEGQIRIVTIAPELPGAAETIAAATQLGIRCSMGHSDADLAAARAGIEAGARQATHTFNAMPPLDHRTPNLLTAVMTDPRVRAELIADGIHVHPLVVDILLRTKGPEGVMLITDGISATGMPEGRYRLGPLEVEVRDGTCTYEGKLAGSVLTLDRAVRNAAKFAAWPLSQALRLATYNPAEAMGLTDGRGTLRAGGRADFVVLTPQGEVVEPITGGRRGGAEATASGRGAKANT